jgi:2-polyprenyl-6-hydroxyphenyl methylase/3-demethylubiquinone-9 3-methyltransferase
MKNNTINKKEIEKFSKIAEEWWNPEGKFKPLHKFNPIRISYIKDNIIKTLNLKIKKTLRKIKILDIGVVVVYYQNQCVDWVQMYWNRCIRKKY